MEDCVSFRFCVLCAVVVNIIGGSVVNLQRLQEIGRVFKEILLRKMLLLLVLHKTGRQCRRESLVYEEFSSLCMR